MRVTLLPDKGCWIALPQRLAAQLLDADTELPLVVQLVPVDATGAHVLSLASHRPQQSYAGTWTV